MKNILIYINDLFIKDGVSGIQHLSVLMLALCLLLQCWKNIFDSKKVFQLEKDYADILFGKHKEKISIPNGLTKKS